MRNKFPNTIRLVFVQKKETASIEVSDQLT